MQYVIEVCSLPEGEHVGWLNKDGDIVCREQAEQYPTTERAVMHWNYFQRGQYRNHKDYFLALVKV